MKTDGKDGRSDKDVKLDQFRVDPGDVLTTEQGVAVTDDRNSLRVGARGPTLLEDFMLRGCEEIPSAHRRARYCCLLTDEGHGVVE